MSTYGSGSRLWFSVNGGLGKLALERHLRRQVLQGLLSANFGDLLRYHTPGRWVASILARLPNTDPTQNSAYDALLLFLAVLTLLRVLLGAHTSRSATL